MVKAARDVCVTFWYHAWGSTVGTLSVRTRHPIRKELSPSVWRISGDQGERWRPAAVSISRLDHFELVFEATNGRGELGDIAIDDVFIDTHPSSAGGACPPAGSCSFDGSQQNGMCLWTHETPRRRVDDDTDTDIDDPASFQLVRINAQHLTRLLAANPASGVPLIDTDASTRTAHGHFLWANHMFAASNSTKAQQATIVSETLFSAAYPNGSCFAFSYLMTGNTQPGVVRLFARHSSLATSRVELFEVLDYTEPEWHRSYVDLHQTTSAWDTFELVIQVELGSSPHAQLAIDKLVVHDSSCESVRTSAVLFDCGERGVHVAWSQVCNWVRDCPNGADERECGACDFEASGMCGWREVGRSMYEWSRLQARDAASTTAPHVDHTLHTAFGHYASVQMFGNHQELGVARMQLAEPGTGLQPCSSTCEVSANHMSN